MGGALQAPPHYRPMCEGGVTEAPAAVGGVGTGGAVIALRAYGQPLTIVNYFCCLVLTLKVMENHWLAVVGNLWKARWTWARLSQVLGREGADKDKFGCYYLAVVQAILIFGFETRVVTPRIVPAWAKGFDQDTSVFSMIGVTGSIP